MSPTQILASALWGIGLLAALLGWGRLVAAGVGVRERAHVGLELAWGLAIVLCMGGWLCLVGAAKPPALMALVALGIAGCLLPRRRGRVEFLSAPGVESRLGLLVVCVALLGLTLAIGFVDRRFQPPDDHAAYFFHAKKIIETGTLIEPFSFRRIASYGGQSFLQALLLVVSPMSQLNLIDKGIAKVAVAICLLGYALVRPGNSLIAAAVSVYAVAAYHDTAPNTSSIFTGVLAFLGLWLTLELCRDEDVPAVSKGVLTGLVIAGLVPLRQNYALACALIVLLEHGRRFFVRRDRSQYVELSVAGLVAAIGLGGWALLQIRSGATPLFPLVQGHGNPEWGAVAAESFGAYIRALQNFLGWKHVLIPVLLCGLALSPRKSGEPASIWPLGVGGLLAFLGNGWMLAHAHPSDFTRYTAGFLLAIGFLVWTRAVGTIAGIRSPTELRDVRPWLAALALITLVWLLPPVARLGERVQALQNWMTRVEHVMGNPSRERSYERLQAAAPPGAKLLAMVDHPYLFDLNRNDVMSLDIPGGASPPPGLHRQQTPEDVVRYFVDQGRPWLATVRPARSRHLYKRDTWNDYANGVRVKWLYDPSDVVAWIAMGRTVVGFFEQLDVIIESCRKTYDDRKLLMINLSQCDFETVPPTAIRREP